MSTLTWMALLGIAMAQEGPELDGEWRVIGSTLSDFPIFQDTVTVNGQDFQGTGQGQWLDHRLRTGVSGRIVPVLEAATQMDLAVGTTVADPWLLAWTPDERRRFPWSATSPYGLKFRRLSAQTVAGNMQIEAGLVTSKWGLGLVANDGASEPLFGRSDFGDRTLRFRATHIPGGDGPQARTTILTTGAVDLVVADEIAALSTGERAFQAIVSVLALGREGNKAGAYMVVRNQWEAEPGRSTQAFVMDGFVDRVHELGPEIKLRTAAEVAGILGRTNRATTYNARGRIGIAQLGAVSEITLDARDSQFQLHLISGYASGDGDPDDAISTDFTFDRDYGVGMVMFDEVMAGIEGGTWLQVTDPANAGVPPDGAELLVTEGAVRRAAFFQPAVQVKPVEWLDLRGGFAMAFSTNFFAQPFETVRNGGVPTNHLGVEVDSRYLGAETDWSVGVTSLRNEDKPDRALYGFTIQGGHFGVGPALSGPGMPPTVTLITGTARMTW